MLTFFMPHLVDITTGIISISFLTDDAKKTSNKHRSLLLGEKSSLSIEQDFMINPDLDKSLMSAIKGKLYKEDY